MSRATVLLRRYGLLVLGAVGIIVGLIILTRPAPASFGWTAYAPLSNTTFVPPSFVTGTFLLGALLLAVGLGLAGVWVGFVLGRRTRG